MNKVAHICRTYLPQYGDPFIGYQVTAHMQYEPFVFCHQRMDDHLYDVKNIYCGSRMGREADRYIQDLSYKYFKRISMAETRIFLEIIHKQNINILHFHYLTDASCFINLLRESGLPSIISCYGYDVSSFPKRFFGLARYYLLPAMKAADRIIAMSKDMKADLINIGCDAAKIDIHYYGIECDRFICEGRVYENRENINILCVGALEERKGHMVLLEAIKKANIISPNLKFKMHLVGTGYLGPAIRKRSKELAIDKDIIFHGYIRRNSKEFTRLFATADIFCLPSLTGKKYDVGEKEGIPGAIVESMAAGLPIIATYHAGIPDIVDDGVNGFLVDERDVEQLAHKLALLSNDHKLREKMGRSGALKARRFYDKDKKIRDLEYIYNSAIG